MSDLEVRDTFEVEIMTEDNTNSTPEDGEVRDPNRDQDLEAARTPNRDDGGRKRVHSVDGLNEGDSVPKRARDDDDFNVKKLIKEEDEGKWALPESLATHFVSHTKFHISDQNTKKNMNIYVIDLSWQ